MDVPKQREFADLSKFVMKTGTYEGKLICQVPLGHLKWLARQHVAKSTKQAVARYIELSNDCVWLDAFICCACGTTSNGDAINYHSEKGKGPTCSDCGSREITIVREPALPQEEKT